MAKKKNENVILENVELKPQVLGYTFQKKNNIGRVIFIFIAFILVVYYIDDISVFFNNLLGRETPSTISSNANNGNKDKEEEKENKEEDEYYSLSDDLKIEFENLTFDNFNLNNNTLIFDINNLSQESVDVSSKNIFLETYDADKAILERFKLNINTIANNSKISLNLNVKQSFDYFTLVVLTEDDYPAVNLSADENGESKIVCTKDKETITYTFDETGLTKINHKIVDNDISNENYNINLNNYQSKVNNYKEITGVEASFTSNLTGYTVDINLDLAKVDLSKINEKNYYAYHRAAKVIFYEMPTNGFTCN